MRGPGQTQPREMSRPRAKPQSAAWDAAWTLHVRLSAREVQNFGSMVFFSDFGMRNFACFPSRSASTMPSMNT